MITRRRFLQTSSLAAAGLALPGTSVAARKGSTGYFAVHPFIDRHPEAVFVMKSSVKKILDSRGKRKAGHAFGRSVFVASDSRGIPVTAKLPIKPNMKTPRDPGNLPMIDRLGVTADPYFVEGVFDAMLERGVKGDNIHMMETNRLENIRYYPYPKIAERIGAHIRFDQKGTIDQLEEGRHYSWTEVRDGVVFKRIPHLDPINTPGSWMLNISKFKAHYMGLTLCCKNLQGSTVDRYQRFCNSLGIPDIFPDNQFDDAEARIRKLYRRHLDDGVFPRWDKGAEKYDVSARYPDSGLKYIEWGGGFTMETWTARTLDNVSSMPCGLHVIEGIYGHDGSASDSGPHPFAVDHEYGVVGHTKTGKAKSYLTNVIIFGKDPLLVDSIGFWLGGHEPGNFGFFHIAMERGMMKVIDPRKIPVYVWDNGEAALTPLEELKRTPLLSFYLGKEGEAPYHLVDEPFDYMQINETAPSRPEKPDVTMLEAMIAAPSDKGIPIEYSMPESGFVRLEIRDILDGSTLDVPVDTFRTAGSHLAWWDMHERPAGVYRYFMNINGLKREGTVRLLH